MAVPRSLTEVVAALRAAEHVELLPPLSFDAVEAFEAALGVTVPVAYRQFITAVGSGILLEGEPWLFTPDDALLVIGQQRSDPTQDFPYGEVEAEALLARARSGPRGGLLTDPAFIARQQQGPHFGCLPLTDHGDGEGCVLVLAGPQRGVVWRVGTVDLPEVPATYGADRSGHDAWSPMGFADWLPWWSWQFLGL